MKMSNSIKEFFSKYRWLILLEIVIIIIFLIVSQNIDETNGLSLFFSSEVLVALLVGVGAIYSWLSNKRSEQYENDLKLLQNIDELIKDYQGRGKELELYNDSEISNFVKGLEGNYKSKNDNQLEFLKIYYEYIRSKVTPDDEGTSESEEEVSSNSRRIANGIKSRIAAEEGIRKEYIRFSRNYDESNKNSEYDWSTWFSLPKDLIDNSSDNLKFIFFTNVEGKYEGVEIKSNDLRRLAAKKMKVTKEKSGRETYDFYICKESPGKYYDRRQKNNLTEYGMKPLNLDYINSNF